MTPQQTDASTLFCGYSTISPKELMIKVLPGYCLEKPTASIFWERGANDTYKVICADTSYFLRIYRCDAYTHDANEFEAEALSYLHQKGFSVAYPVPKKSGGYITKIAAFEGTRHILISTMAEGNEPDYDSLDHCRLVGESVAKMHLTSNGFKTTRDRHGLDCQWLLENSMTVIQGYLKNSRENLTFIEAIAQKVRVAVDSVELDSLDFGICHGDLHGGNLHIHDGKVTHFDFEECAFGYRVYDLATFKWGVCMGDAGPKRWAAFLGGYESVRPVAEEALSLVNTFVIIRELAETAYGIRHVHYFGHNGIMASDIDDMCNRLRKLTAMC